ncbi:MAG: DUF2341 domain-containing protein [Chitinispirillaceae bacterium]|nr:DUF2341 domain-containing protein [Chitinispirillaceae bacterium]
MRVVLVLMSLVLILACRCGLGPLAGGTTDTGNARVAAAVFKQDGSHAAGATVYVRPVSYLKPFVLPKTASAKNMVTDDFGKFEIDSLPDGDYCIEVNDRIASSVIFTITVSNQDTNQIVLQDTLRPYAGIEGSIDQEPPVFTFMQVYGLERCVTVSPSGLFSILDLPAGAFTVRIASTDPSFEPQEIAGIACSSGAVTTLPLATWSHSRRIVLNTSATGANVSATVTNFPVLVRLTSSLFDFSQARSDGADIRFVKPDMTPLAYEVERWDPAAGAADVWVKVDTLLGNNSTQHILMYWGNPNALSQSNGTQVFDTANGFRGVWHLGEKSGTVDDATHNRHNGSRIGNQSQTPGVIGFGQAYVDSGDYSDMGNVLDPAGANLTISAWVKRSVVGGVYTIVGKTNGDTILEPNYGWLMAFNVDYPIVYLASSGVRWGDAGTFLCESSVKITDRDTWHHICAVIDRSGNAGCRMYVDGVEGTRIRVGDITAVGSLTNALPMRIGIEADNDYPLRGFVDEVVVSYVIHSADWVRLCYMNQKPDNQLVEFR